ncbi:MAG: hypothetical protein IPH13_03205 [Planctomycetes bacterium]|nr:hypothetical protein [Planctomycetota bacterium]MCC7170128.1 hypothetical protein [Planctomycetota bacterium]
MKPFRGPAVVARAVSALALCVSAGCASYSQELQEYRLRYGAGEFASAEAALDERIADETGIANELLQQPKTLARAEDVADGNGHLLLLEKAMTRLGQGDPDGCIELLRRARDELDARYATSAVEAVKMTLSDDTARDYAGADYEHVLVRAMLALADLVSGGQDAFAYAVQIGTKQEEILGSEFGAEQGYKPRELYRRIAIGAYLEGVIQEAEHQPSEAARAYQRAKQYGGDSALLDAAIQRTVFGRYAREGCGVVHVFYLGGRGPHLVEGVDVATDQASKLAGIVIALLRDRGSAFLQAPIKVPVVAVTDRTLAPLAIGGDAIGNEFTTPLVDVNEIAIEQLEANLPWIQARALVRRGLKSFASAIAEMKFDERENNGLAFLTAAMLNYIATATENADTRNWTALPASFQAARIEVPAGDREFVFDGTTRVRVRVAAGHESYVVFLRTAPTSRGAVLIDKFSWPLGATSAPDATRPQGEADQAIEQPGADDRVP